MSGTEERKAEDWERMVDVEKKLLKEIERKLRHRDDQKCVTRRKRDSFLVSSRYDFSNFLLHFIINLKLILQKRGWCHDYMIVERL